jgi:signal transduction histidine kinase
MDTRPPTVTSRALAALSAAIELGDARQVALASFDAVLSGATRDEVEQVVHGAPAHPSEAGRSGARSAGTPGDQAWMNDVAEALGGSLLAEEGTRVRLLNSAALQMLGADFDEGLVTAVERLTRSDVHHLDVHALLSRARERGSAWGRVDQQLVWAQRTALGLLVFVQGGISRSSAPPPDEVAALRHELANAMTAIAGLAAQAQGDASDEAALRALARIRAVADTAVTDARHKVGVVMPGPRDVSRELADLVGDLAPFASQRGVEVEARVEPGVRTRISASTLRLVVWNLLKNAIEASPPHSVVVVSGEHRAGSLRLAVEDRGAGLSAAMRTRVFEPHFSTKDDGRGLGLSLVQAEVVRLGGHVDVSSPPRGGTRFTVTLPGAEPAEVHPFGAPESSGVVSKNPLRGTSVALLCDFAFLQHALAALGADVTRTTLDALLAKGTVTDVLVADAAEVSLEVAVQLRRDRVARRVIFLAADGELPVVDGVDAILARSFDLRELADTIEMLLALESNVG